MLKLYRCMTLIAVLLLVGGGALAFAAGPKFMTGKWKVTSTSYPPMGGKSKTKTSTECITEENADPSKTFLSGVTKDQCSVDEPTIDGDTVKWDMTCSGMPGGSAKGAAELTIQGKKAAGKMEMTMTFNGQTMEFKNTWTGEHVGACD